MNQYNWEEDYKSNDILWGLKPNEVLTRYVKLLPENGKVLDIGIGEGRNALYLAKLGFEVEGIDLSQTAVQRCKELSNKYGVQLKASVNDILSFDISSEKYDLIILSNVLNFFTPDEIRKIINKVNTGLRKNGLIYITAFNIAEPSIENIKKKYEEIDENTYFNHNKNMNLHYFTETEFKGLVSEYEIISFSNSYSLDLSHGKPHYHSSFEILSRK